MQHYGILEYVNMRCAIILAALLIAIVSGFSQAIGVKPCKARGLGQVQWSPAEEWPS